ncbi:tyrosine-type recombinase/integrase [Nitrosarchaeum sp. AC2]|uniref:tyrosine-type recombinase/integrase n=1 Tax=Nitrosarchaeum sp. AC2 TaxID=2259673 RepID=UPI0015CE7F42|nr:tyrosine-type recombinase/integrase [Nitrosarchaeum sp. AC2]QLH10813.1 integrase [Nitrosarchaeum sp. AC2]
MSTKTQQKSKQWDIHDYDHTLDLIHIRAKKELSKRNLTLFQDYDKSMVRIPLAKATRIKHLSTLLTETKMLNKDWKDALRSDIDDVVYKIMETYSDEKGQESNTSFDMKKILRIFYRWMKTGNRNKNPHEIDPYEIQGITLRRVKDKIAREDLLNDDDLERLLKSCGDNARDRAFIDVHTEAGTRPGETLSLRIKDVKTDEHGIIINVIGKTYARPVRLIRSVPNLLAYIRNHPNKNEPEAPLWIMIDSDDYGKPMSYHGARAMILRRVKNAKMSKRVYLNLFRHSEATKTANFLTEAQMRKRHGWTADSKMPARYVHLVDSDVESAIFDHYGIAKKEELKPDIPIKCHICEMYNDPDSKICSKCGKILDLKTALENEEKIVEERQNLKKEVDDLKENLASMVKQKIEEYNKNFLVELEKMYDKENKLLVKRLDLMDKEFCNNYSK